MEPEPVTEPKRRDVLLENRANDRKVEATPGHVRMRECHLNGDTSLGTPDVDELPDCPHGNLLAMAFAAPMLMPVIA